MDVILVPLGWIIWAVAAVYIVLAVVFVLVVVVVLLAVAALVSWVVYCGLSGRDL